MYSYLNFVLQMQLVTFKVKHLRKFWFMIQPKLVNLKNGYNVVTN